MKALRIHVERIVRPIRASVRRKNKMREELLAHLAAAFDEERAIADSDEDAFACAMERLGNPATLRHELQASVPWIERVGFSFLLLRLDSDAFGKDERFGWRGSARIATEIASLIVVLGVAFLAVEFIIDPDAGLNYGEFLLEHLLVFGGMLGSVWAALFAAHLLFDAVGARNAMSPWSARPPFGKACLYVLQIVFTWILFLVSWIPLAETMLWGQTPYLAAEGLLETAQSTPHWFWLSILCATVVYLTIGKRRERRQYEKWGILDIDAETGN